VDFLICFHDRNLHSPVARHDGVFTPPKRVGFYLIENARHLPDQYDMNFSAAPVPVPRKRLLLVDDDDALRRILNTIVQDWSFATATAATLHEARHAVETEAPFTIIVCDYSLPDGNGLEFFGWVRRELLVQIPFLLISGGAERWPGPSENYEFLAKPFRLEEFQRRLEELCCVKFEPTPPAVFPPVQYALAS